ncbi:MAG: hypothetical protein WC761_01870 [Candidatus Paceibacterota bacterium]|jgi:hypothetical protein
MNFNFKIPMFKQSDGTPSASFTMMAVGFGVVTLWLLLSIVEEIAGMPIREFNGAEAMAYFTPLAMLYFGRRWTTEMGQGAATKLIETIQGEKKTNSVRPPAEAEEEIAEETPKK